MKILNSFDIMQKAGNRDYAKAGTAYLTASPIEQSRHRTPVHKQEALCDSVGQMLSKQGHSTLPW